MYTSVGTSDLQTGLCGAVGTVQDLEFAPDAVSCLAARAFLGCEDLGYLCTYMQCEAQTVAVHPALTFAMCRQFRLS